MESSIGYARDIVDLGIAGILVLVILLLLYEIKQSRKNSKEEKKLTFTAHQNELIRLRGILKNKDTRIDTLNDNILDQAVKFREDILKTLAENEGQNEKYEELLSNLEKAIDEMKTTVTHNLMSVATALDMKKKIDNC